MEHSIALKALRVLGLEKKEKSAAKPATASENPPPAAPKTPIEGLIIDGNMTKLSRAPPDVGDPPIPYNATFCPLETTMVDSVLVKNTSWTTPEVTRGLRFPLCFALRHPDDVPETRRSRYNSQSHIFMIGIDPADDSFSKFVVQPVPGDAAVIRKDGKPLKAYEFAIMSDYIIRFLLEGQHEGLALEFDMKEKRKVRFHP